MKVALLVDKRCKEALPGCRFRADVVMRLDEDGALAVGGWWRGRADGRGEDAEVDEPGAWVGNVSKTVSLWR